MSPKQYVSLSTEFDMLCNKYPRRIFYVFPSSYVVHNLCIFPTIYIFKFRSYTPHTNKWRRKHKEAFDTFRIWVVKARLLGADIQGWPE